MILAFRCYFKTLVLVLKFEEQNLGTILKLSKIDSSVLIFFALKVSKIMCQNVKPMGSIYKKNL